MPAEYPLLDSTIWLGTPLLGYPVEMKLLFAPLGLAAGLVAGLVAQKAFERLWAAFDDEGPPGPNQRDASYPRLIGALVAEGAVFRLTKGMVDHSARRAFARATGEWPGESPESENERTKGTR